MSDLDISKIVQAPLPESQYYKEESDKKQIVIHHTAGGPNAKNVVAGWKSDEVKVGTAFIIDGEGIIHQCFSSKYWAHHLGTKLSNNSLLNKRSVAIEVTNWGGLTKKDGKFYNYVNKEVPANEVYTFEHAFRGSKYFHKYNEKQIESLRQLIVYLAKTYKISLTYYPEIWDLSAKAMNGSNGIFTHVSYRRDKQDMSPQEDLINMLRNLQKTN